MRHHHPHFNYHMRSGEHGDGMAGGRGVGAALGLEGLAHLGDDQVLRAQQVGLPIMLVPAVLVAIFATLERLCAARGWLGATLVAEMEPAKQRYAAWFSQGFGIWLRAHARDHLQMDDVAVTKLMQQWEADRA